jgi:anaerobic magnesium-protoporphyrin IX monomethyl ester cyclase
MKTLLTHAYFLEEDLKEREIMRPYVPLGILSISSYLEEHGYENAIFDSTFSSFEKLKNYFLKESPDVVAIYTNLMTKLNVLKIVQFIRSEQIFKNTKIILGGPEVRHHAENFLKYGADVIVIGEGEETTLQLLQTISSGSADWNNISGLAYMNDQKELIFTAERKLCDINQLPFPNRKKIDLKRYASVWKEKHGYSMFSVSTMRGCPYTCKWCSRAVYGGTYRRRKPGLVAEEMLLLKKEYNPDMVWFVDDVFTISHKWLREFAEEVKKKDAKIPYEIISRADRMNEEVVQLLKESGCARVWIGAESGSQRIIDAMDRRVDVKQVREMIRLTRSYGIQASTFIMLGYPGEEKEDIRETIRHLKESEPDQYTITIAYPIKGTPLYAETESRFYGQLEWEKSTDRDIDFKRQHTRKFYEYGLRWVFNEVNFDREWNSKNKNWLKLPYYKMKSIAAQGGMWLEKWNFRLN